MLSVVDNFLETLHGGRPDGFVREWEPFRMVVDPLMQMTLVARPGEEVIDPWGVTVAFDTTTNSAMPIITEENKVCPDITEWEKYVHAPDLITPEKDWESAIRQVEEAHANGKLAMSLMAVGVFESTHFLIGFEDTLMNVLMEPEYYKELTDYITEYKLGYIKLLCENVHPDVILFHDDWGSKQNLFMPPTCWQEMYKENYRKIYDTIHSYDAIVIHHADSFCEQIVSDMVDIGMDVWEGTLPENDIPKLQKETAGKLVYMGGIDASLVDVPNWKEEIIRGEVQRACLEYAPGGSFIPCLTYGGEGSIYPGVNDIIMDEIKRLSSQYF